MLEYLKVYLNGTEVPQEDIVDIGDVNIVKRVRYPNDNSNTGFTIGLRFTGNTARFILNSLLFDQTLPFIEAEIWDECCSEPRLLIKGRISPDGLTFCQDCPDGRSNDVEVELTSSIELSCLEYKYVFESQIVNIPNPFVRYCIELRPSFVHDLIIAITFAVMVGLTPMALTIGVVFTAINLIIGIINVMIAVLNTLPNVSINKINYIGGNLLAFDILSPFIQQMGEWAVGCKRGHTVYYLRDLLTLGCQECNLAFDSSLFRSPNNDLYFTALMPRSVRKGYENYMSWSEPNKPLKTVAMLLDEVATAVNGVWWIENGVVRLEPKSEWRNMNPTIELEPDNPDIISVCYEFDIDQVPAVLEINPKTDGIDWVGMEAKRHYQELVSYTGSQKLVRGIRRVELPFGPSRFRDDGIERDVQSFWAGFLGGGAAQFLANLPVLGTFFNTFLSAFIDAKKDYDSALLLPTDTHAEDKWLVIDPNSNPVNAKVKRVPAGGGKWNYNWGVWVATWLSAYLPNKAILEPNLYRFFADDNPLVNQTFGLKFELKMIRTCQYIDAFKPGARIKLPVGVGLIEEVQIDSNEITIRGLI